MFIPKEIRFLKEEVSDLIETLRSSIHMPDVDQDIRDNLESRLITAVSIMNKLEYSKPEKTGISKNAKVLIVDDVESMRKMHKHLFAECGFTKIDLAEDGLKAYKHMRQSAEIGKPYHLVVSDWEMPRVTGLDLLKKVRTDRDLWRTPFFLITSLSEKKHIIEGINAGATGYMLKPLNQKIVNKKFAEYLN